VPAAARALACLSGVFFDPLPTSQCGFVCDEVEQLGKRPTVYHAVDLTRHLHAVPNAQELFDVQYTTMCSHDIDNLPTDLVIHLGDPPGFFALGPFDHPQLALLL